ncbi:MAG: NAD(P)-dependent oxidoreductase [Candidatus Omnitrophica bacterium]|nr:NAD(P)-dependent oxidoreductase [Candidatus Omnitrophota bacterium]
MTQYGITGGLGFLGRHLTAALLKQGGQVRIFDAELGEPPAPCEIVRGDIRDTAAVDLACRDVEVLFSLAALQPFSRAGRRITDVNANGTARLLDAASRHGVHKFVHLSSSVIYGIPRRLPLREDDPLRPIGVYGQSKVRAEQLCLEASSRGLDVTILRPRFIVGPGRLGVLQMLFECIRAQRPVPLIGSGHNRFQMVGVQDVVSACLAAAERGPSGGVFNIGADTLPTVRELLSALITHARSRSRLMGLPAAIAKAALRALDACGLSPLTSEHYLIADRDYIVDTAKAKRLLQWSPQEDTTQAMLAAYDWFLQHRHRA